MKQTYDTPGQVTIDVQIAAGDIDVRTADTDVTSIEITGYDKAAPPSITCDETSDGGHRVTIEHRRKRVWGFSLGRGLDVKLTVPEGTRLDGSSGAAELEIDGTLGSLDFRSGAGDVTFDEITGDVQIACASGDIEGQRVGGQFGFKGASGDISIESIGGGATVRSASGDITIGRLEGPTTITLGSGDVDLREVGGGDINVRTIAGDVHVGVLQGLRVWLDLSATGGDVRSDLADAERGDTSAPTQLELTVNTVSGDIEVRRAASAKR